jgi:hypothetical protein
MARQPPLHSNPMCAENGWKYDILALVHKKERSFFFGILTLLLSSLAPSHHLRKFA